MWLLTLRFKTSTICFSSFWGFFFYFFAPPRTWFYILSISLSRTRLFFFFRSDSLDAQKQRAECGICTAAVRTAWLWHLHRQPRVLRRGRLLSVGRSQPSGDSLHTESLSLSGGSKGWRRGRRITFERSGKVGGGVLGDRVWICNGHNLIIER